MKGRQRRRKSESEIEGFEGSGEGERPCSVSAVNMARAKLFTALCHRMRARANVD